MKFYHPSISIIKKYLLNFYQNKQAVYVPMMALLSFVVIGYIAFVVDGTGLILDKVRLTQGVEQANLALIAENNKYRKDKKHYYLEHATASSSSEADKINARNHEIITGIVRSYYLPGSFKNNHMPANNFDITDQYSYRCAQNATQTEIACLLDGNFDRPSWLYLGEDYKKNFGLTFNKTQKVAANSSAVIKASNKDFEEIPAPMDVVIVTDLSGSMALKSPEDESKTKIQALRNTLEKISKIILQDGNQDNRLRYVSFSGGAVTPEHQDYCTLPYKMLDKRPDLDSDIFKSYRKETEYFCNRNGVVNKKTVSGWKKIPVRLQDKVKRNIRNQLEFYLSEALELKYVGNNKHLDTYKEGFKIRNNLRKKVSTILNNGVDINKTIQAIEKYDGSSLFETKNNFISFPRNEQYCLGGSDLYINYQNEISCNNTPLKFSSNWYKHGEYSNLIYDFNRIIPQGWTLASSGLLVGANAMLAEKRTKPLKSNVMRKIIILSDGTDEFGSHGNTIDDMKFKYTDVTKRLIQNNMCGKIRERLNKEQLDQYTKYDAQIFFIAFAYNDKDYEIDRYGKPVLDSLGRRVPKTKADWLQCVGKENYYMEARNENELITRINKALNEVSIIEKPSNKENLNSETGIFTDSIPSYLKK